MIDDPLVKSLLTNVVEDESNLPIVQALIDGVETDEAIAEKTEIKLNIVRKILYKLYDMGLATYKRSKDTQLPGTLLKSIPASDAGFSACFKPYNCNTTSL